MRRRGSLAWWPGNGQRLCAEAYWRQIFQASHAARKLGRNIRLLTRNKVVGSLGPDGRLKFLSPEEAGVGRRHSIAIAEPLDLFLEAMEIVIPEIDLGEGPIGERLLRELGRRIDWFNSSICGA